MSFTGGFEIFSSHHPLGLSPCSVLLLLGLPSDFFRVYVGVRNRFAGAGRSKILLLLEHVEDLHVSLLLAAWVVSQCRQTLIRLLLLYFLGCWCIRFILACLLVKSAHRTCGNLGEGQALHQSLMLTLPNISPLTITLPFQSVLLFLGAAVGCFSS